MPANEPAMNPNDPTVPETVEAIRAGARKGAYASTAAWADALPEPIRRAPEVALERARLRLRQGRNLLAQAALAEARIEDAPPGVRAQLAMEEASVLIARDLDFPGAAAAADAALTRAAGLDDPVQRAQLAAEHARLVLVAAAHFAMPPEAASAASASLRGAAEILEREGRVDDALAARHVLATREQAGAPTLDALAAVAERALAAGRPHLAAEAGAGRAELLMKQAPAEDVLAELDAAETLYVGHELGAIDVRRLRAKLAADREAAGTAELEECLRLYRARPRARRADRPHARGEWAGRRGAHHRMSETGDRTRARRGDAGGLLPACGPHTEPRRRKERGERKRLTPFVRYPSVPLCEPASES